MPRASDCGLAGGGAVGGARVAEPEAEDPEPLRLVVVAEHAIDECEAEVRKSEIVVVPEADPRLENRGQLVPEIAHRPAEEGQIEAGGQPRHFVPSAVARAP